MISSLKIGRRGEIRLWDQLGLIFPVNLFAGIRIQFFLLYFERHRFVIDFGYMEFLSKMEKESKVQQQAKEKTKKA